MIGSHDLITTGEFICLPMQKVLFVITWKSKSLISIIPPALINFANVNINMLWYCEVNKLFFAHSGTNSMLRKVCCDRHSFIHCTPFSAHWYKSVKNVRKLRFFINSKFFDFLISFQIWFSFNFEIFQLKNFSNSKFFT